MPDYSYFPILKTTDAELNGFGALPSRVRDNVLPIFELTRSRRSKKNADGDVDRRLDSLEKCLGRRPFILDLTTERTLQNKQIDKMLQDETDGFSAWVSFVKSIVKRGLSVIPTIHYIPSELPEVRAQIRALRGLSDCLAFRVEVEEPASEYLQEILKAIEPSRVILILDGKYVSDDSLHAKEKLFRKALESISKMSLRGIVCAASSFPTSFKDTRGHFPVLERGLTEGLRGKYPILHGDFGSVHPIRYEARWGGWVPRIDFVAGNYFHYYRCRRESGGYVEAAGKVLGDSHYSPIQEFETWGDSEIQAAANGAPGGLSPSHWIAVRINLFIVRQFLNLRKYPKMSV